MKLFKAKSGRSCYKLFTVSTQERFESKKGPDEKMETIQNLKREKDGTITTTTN